jgi:threonyl-tRNA synthetase
MIVTLKDGSKKEYAEAKSVIDIAYDISEGLARAACAGEVNGEVVDLRTVIDSDCELNILTAKDEKGLAVLRPGSTDLIPGCKGCYRTFY